MFRKKIFWQVILGLLILALCIFFIRNEHVEVKQIRNTLENAKPLYIVLGILITAIYLLLQSLMYVESFACVKKKVNLYSTLLLFLKRNVVSVFLPAGGGSSLAFFTKEIEGQKVHKSQIYFASYIYGICGMLSVIVVAIPTLGYLLVKHTLTSTEVYAFLALLILVSIIAIIGYSLMKKGRAYRWSKKFLPSLAVLIDELQSSEFSMKHFIYTNIVSVFIEFAGIAHLYIAMLALGLPPSMELALVGYVLMVVLLIVSPVLRGIGPIEVAMTILFVQYGFSTEIAASAILLFRFFEFWLPLMAGIVSFYTKRDNIVLRIMPALLILALGIINIVSAITPAIPGRLEIIKTVLSHDVIYVSNYLVIVFGVILCIVSIFLLRGVRSAWWVALLIATLSIVGHISKAIDYEEALLGVLALFSLLISRKEYILRSDKDFQRKGLLNFTVVFLAVLVYGIVGFYYLDKRHFGIEFDFKNSVMSLFHIFFLFDTGSLVPRTHFAHYFLNSIYTLGVTTILFALYTIVKPYITRPNVTKEDLEKANVMLTKYGDSALDYFKTYADKLIFFSNKVDGFIAYRSTPVFAIVLEKPVCANEQDEEIIIREFDDWCTKVGLKAAYYRVAEKDVPFFRSLGKKSLKIGQEAIVNLETFSLSGKDMKPMRNAINKVAASGFKFSVFQAPIKEGVLQKLKQVSDEWLTADNRKEVVFASGVFNPAILKTHTIFIVENIEEKIVAFADQIPDFVKGEATYDLIRKSNDGPNGVIDFLLVNMFEYLKEKGYKQVNMGLAPMTGLDKTENIAERTIKLAYDNIRQFGHYKGLREYKEKFFPEWENKYLIYVNDYNLLQIPRALNEVTRWEI
jgi:phosphatidylglycerol lysyltransferase